MQVEAKQINSITEGINYVDFLENRLKSLYSRKRKYKNIVQLYSRVEYELMYFVRENNIVKGSKEEKKLIALLNASISEAKPSDKISMFCLIFAFYGVYIAVYPMFGEKTWVEVLLLFLLIVGYACIIIAQKWFNSTSKKLTVLNICLDILKNR